MNYDERVQLAAELIDLRVLGWVVPEELGQRLPPEVSRTMPSLSAACRQALAEVYAEHYDGQQLLAELNFYRGELGQGILAAQKKIRVQVPVALERALEPFGGLATVMQRIVAAGGASRER